MELGIGFVVGAGSALLLVAVAMAARAGGLSRVAWGLTVAGRAVYDSGFEARVRELMGLPAAAPPPPVVPPPVATVPPAPPKPTGAPLRLLALLQAEARLVDFLLEDISGATDDVIGMAVRKIHTDAKAALQKVLTIEPVLAGNEGDTVTVPSGFDPAAVQVIGNVTGNPPFSGELQHPGLKVTDLRLAPGPDGFVLQPAVVQVA